MFKIFKNKVFISVFAVATAAALVGVYTARDGNDQNGFIVVQRQDLVKEVSVTGNVEPVEAVNLSFERSGVVSNLYYDVGDKVQRGQLIAQLRNQDIVSDLAEAEADVEAARAELEKLQAGTRQEEIEVQRTKVQNAESSVEDARQKLVDALEDAYTKTDNVIGNKIDQFFENPRSGSPDFNIENKYDQVENDVEFQRVRIRGMLSTWEENINTLTTESDLDSYLDNARDNLQTVRLFLNDVGFIINDLTPNADLSQTDINGYKADVETARDTINSERSDLSTAESELSSAESDLRSAKEELDLKLAGTRPEEIRAQEAALEQARARVQSIRANLEETRLASPITGTITDMEVEAGEAVSANQNIASIISEDNLEIEADIPEVDIDQVDPGDKARITLDAFGPETVFDATVVSVDPSSKVVDGVVAYNTTLNFDENYPRIRPGMTANVFITAEKRENVLSVPRRALITRSGRVFVEIVEGSGEQRSIREVEVETGLKSSNSRIEILSGLEEGDKVLVDN